MHVAFNATFWARPNAGSGQYIRQLVAALNRLISDLKITLIVPLEEGEVLPEDVPQGVAAKGVA